MEKIKNIIISYWYDKLDYNPKDKVYELENELKSIFDNGFLYSEEDASKLLTMPRIQSFSKDKKYLFQMSLINANLIISVDTLDIDEVILLINNKVQLLYGVLKELFNLKFLYTSIKLEIQDEINNSANKLASDFNLNDNYEDFSIKSGFIKDNYYINYILNSGREYNYNIVKKENSLEQDLIDSTMIISLSNAILNKEFILKIIEINDRFAFNKNREYISNLDSIRGMIIELKNILVNKLYEKKN